eukprot:Gb_15807 [translate_table: standard]
MCSHVEVSYASVSDPIISTLGMLSRGAALWSCSRCWSKKNPQQPPAEDVTTVTVSTRVAPVPSNRNMNSNEAPVSPRLTRCHAVLRYILRDWNFEDAVEPNFGRVALHSLWNEVVLSRKVGVGDFGQVRELFSEQKNSEQVKELLSEQSSESGGAGGFGSSLSIRATLRIIAEKQRWLVKTKKAD